jgi:hypothetical protein
MTTLGHDEYYEILLHVHDRATLASWFLASKALHALVTPAKIRACTRPRRVRAHAHWDGPISGLVRYEDDLYVYWRTKDRHLIEWVDFTREIWELIFSAAIDDDGFGEVDTRKYSIEISPTGPSHYWVFKHSRYTLYRSPINGVAAANLSNWQANAFARDYVAVKRKFYEDDIDW